MRLVFPIRQGLKRQHQKRRVRQRARIFLSGRSIGRAADQTVVADDPEAATANRLDETLRGPVIADGLAQGLDAAA